MCSSRCCCSASEVRKNEHAPGRNPRAQFALDTGDEDTQHPRRQRRMTAQRQPHALRQRQNPLSHRYPRDHRLDQMRHRRRHALGGARWAGQTPRFRFAIRYSLKFHEIEVLNPMRKILVPISSGEDQDVDRFGRRSSGKASGLEEPASRRQAPHWKGSFRDEPRATRAYFGGLCSANHLLTCWYQNTEFCGFSTQWFSLG